MSKVVVNIQNYGDFDIPGTCAIMIAPCGFDKAAIRAMIKNVELENNQTSDPENAIRELKRLGFLPCKTINLNIGGAL